MKSRGHGNAGALNVPVAGPPVADADAHDASASPGSSREEGLATRVDCSDDCVRPPVMICPIRSRTWVGEAYQRLIDDWLGNDLDTLKAAKTLDQDSCMAAITVEEPSDAVAAQRPQGGVSRKASRAPGPVRIPVDLVTILVGVGEVGCAQGKYRPVRVLIGNKNVTGIKRRVEHLMTVCGPGIGLLDTTQKVSIRLAGIRPQAECTIDMDPRITSLRDRNNGCEIVKRSGRDVSGLEHQDGCNSLLLVERFLEAANFNPSQMVGGEKADVRGS